MSAALKANQMLRSQVMYLCTQRTGWAGNTHVETLLVDIRDNQEIGNRELAFAIEWLTLLPGKEDQP